MLLKDMTDEQFREYVHKKYPGVNLDAVVKIDRADLMRLEAIQKELLDEYSRNPHEEKPEN